MKLATRLLLFALFLPLPSLAATIYQTQTTDTLDTFRTNVNSSLVNLNTALPTSISTLGTTSISALWPLAWNTTTAAMSWIGLATTTQPASSNILVSDGGKGIYGVGTTTGTVASPLTGNFICVGTGCTLGIQAASGSQNGYLSALDYGLLHAASSTFTYPLKWTGSTNAVTFPATSTLFANIKTGLLSNDGSGNTYGSATSSLSSTYPLSVTNAPAIIGPSGAILSIAFGTTTTNTWGGNNTFTASTTFAAQVNMQQASSTIFTATNLFNTYASSTALSATTLCLTGDICRTTWPAGSSAANPSQSIDLSTHNGAAGTFMRSDAAPALSQSIAPTWTALHIFQGNASSTAFSVFGKSYFGGSATTTIDSAGNITAPSSALATLPNASTTNLTANLSQIIGDGSGSSLITPIRAFTIPFATSTTWTGTSSASQIATLNAPFAMTITQVMCLASTTAGGSPTLNIQPYFGGTATAMLLASSTVGVQTLSSNNTIAKGGVISLYAGTPANAPLFGNCTFRGPQTGQ